MRKLAETIGLGGAVAGAVYALVGAYTFAIYGPPERTAEAAPIEVTQAAPAQSAPAQPVQVAPAQSEPAKPVQVAAAQPAATAAIDATAGQAVFAKCKACHSVDKGKNGVGPSLHGVLNRPVASAPGYTYSDKMKAFSDKTWSPEFLDQYLTDVKKTVPGTKMSFAGVPKVDERHNLIAYLAQQSDSPIDPSTLPFAAAAATAAAPTPAQDAQAAPAEPAAAPAPAVVYADPPASSAEQIAKDDAAAAELIKTINGVDYQRARYSPLHFKPAIDTASNAECLVCHQEVLTTNVRQQSPAGVKAADAKAWYQTLATYDGSQMTFHQRHLSSPYAQAVMNLKCNFCHQGNDPRDESPTYTVASADMTSNNGSEPFTNRKMVNPSETCLRCHGAMPDPVNIMGLPGPWPQARKDLESADVQNGCLTCHGETFRLNRHKVTYLNAATIEDLAKESSDVCYGCHGGRAWYMIPYKYPRHPWPGMDPTVPDWAKDRKTESDPRYAIKDVAQ